MKVWNYMFIMLTLIIFLSFIGLAPTGSDAILNNLSIGINSSTGELTNGDISNSGWSDLLFNKTNGLILLIGIGGAVIVGLFTRTFDWKIVLIAFFTSIVVKFISVGWSIIQLAQSTNQSWLVAVVATVFLPLTAMFVFSIVEWFGGGDN